MTIGVLRLSFAASGDSGLGQKIKDRLWSHFKVATAEVDGQGAMELVIGVSIVANDDFGAQKRIDQIVKHLLEWGTVNLVDHESDVFRYEDTETERNFEKYEP
jgi:uncharacterized protein YlxP (DUF503 family)